MLTVFAFAVPLLALKLSLVGRGYELDRWPTAKIGLKVSLRSMAVSLGFRQCKTIIMPLIPISYSSVSYCRRCLRCAKRCSFCWVRCFLLTSSPSLFTLNLKSAFSRGFSFRKLQIFISQTTDFHFVSFHFVSQTAVSRFNFRCEVFDIRDHGPWTGATPRCLLLNESCWPKILYRKNYGDKKGSKSFQQQIKMFWSPQSAFYTDRL